ncbi:MAG TPA: MarR family transcriptional regulator [Actinobacteria bacterium]|nr:MarR family transcriptional regulator [Actinomycetota bacterium]
MPTSAKREESVSEELLDELSANVIMLGRLFVAQCKRVDPAPVVDGPRLLMLRILSEAGVRRAGELARLLGIKAPATSSLIESLEREGFVLRSHDEHDRRVAIISITDAGARVLRDATAPQRELARRLMSSLPAEDVATLIRIQRSLVAAMTDMDR